MAAICEKLIAGMRKNGIDEETARRIYNQINAFADYGFPESHAASFALIVYASAYLRHYYAPEFLAAMLNAQPMGFYSVGTLIEDARRHGVVVRPIDLTRSAWDHSLELPDRVVIPFDKRVTTRPQAPRPSPCRVTSHESPFPPSGSDCVWSVDLGQLPVKSSRRLSRMDPSPTSATSSGDRGWTRAPCARYVKRARSTAWSPTIHLTSDVVSRCGERWMP
jgi:hypothetical protein